MSDLARFLLARITEDERAAREFIDCDGIWGPDVDNARAGAIAAAFQNGVGSPRRVLAACEAKRRIIDVAVPLSEWTEMGSATDEDGWAILRALALPYADHPDYRGEWRP